jgi:hypothetical protein
VADLLATAANIRATHPSTSVIYDGLAGETITAGQLVYLASTGKYGVADANVAGKQQARGIALNSAGTGAPGLSILKTGPVAGFTTNMPAYDARVYASDTAGAVADTAGTMSVTVGRVGAIPDGGTPSKVIFFDFSWITQWA